MNTVVVIILVVVVVLGIAIAALGWDRYRGHARAGSDAAQYQPTDEVFDDPQSGQRVRVWHDPASGSRDYRPE